MQSLFLFPDSRAARKIACLRFYLNSLLVLFVFAAPLLVALPAPVEPSLNPSGPDDEDALSSAHLIIAEVIARLPANPVLIHGSLIVRRQRGVVLNSHPFRAEIDWNPHQPQAYYQLLDNFGRATAGAAISLDTNGAVRLRWNPVPLGQPQSNSLQLNTLIADSDVAWTDLALPFLWWPEKELIGEDKFRGTDCYKLDMISPQPTPECRAIRVWVDRKLLLIRQIEQVDAQDKIARRLWVSSVGKIGDQWMIRNMEVERPGTGIRTKIEVEGLEAN